MSLSNRLAEKLKREAFLAEYQLVWQVELFMFRLSSNDAWKKSKGEDLI